jgi:hypothetical protein
MKTFTRQTVSNLKQAKKQAKQFRDLRKRGGNISLFEGTLTPKRSFDKDPQDQDGYGLGVEAWS